LPALSRLATVLFVLALPTLLITSNIRFLASEVRVYEYGFRTYHADQATGLPMADLDRAAREVIDYFENNEDTLRILVQDNGDEVSLYNARETEHMRDVKSLMRVVFRLNEISLAFVLAYVTGMFIWSRQPLKLFARRALAGVATGFAAILFVGVFAVTGFDATWSRFHRIFFRSGTWQFDPDTDHLIQMFPEPFWRDVTYFLASSRWWKLCSSSLSRSATCCGRESRTRIDPPNGR
jgi:integral membrane protein (TIGR01906 family)